MSYKAVKIFAEDSYLVSLVSLLLTKPGLLPSFPRNLNPLSLVWSLQIAVVGHLCLLSALPSVFLDSKIKLPGL